MDDMAGIDRAIGDVQAQVKSLQTDIAEVGALCDKYKSESIHMHKSAQAEILRNNDYAKQLNHAENTLKTRINQVEIGRR